LHHRYACAIGLNAGMLQSIIRNAKAAAHEIVVAGNTVEVERHGASQQWARGYVPV
jgi:hypothetical protein